MIARTDDQIDDELLSNSIIGESKIKQKPEHIYQGLKTKKPKVAVRVYGFKKGLSGNPGGKKPLPFHLKELATLTREEHVRILGSILKSPAATIEQILSNPNSTVQEMMIASMVDKCIEEGNVPVYEKLLDRIIGKVPFVVAGQADAPLELKLSDVKVKLLDMINKTLEPSSESIPAQGSGAKLE